MTPPEPVAPVAHAVRNTVGHAPTHAISPGAGLMSGPTIAWPVLVAAATIGALVDFTQQGVVLELGDGTVHVRA
ncbi:hypothetical protein CCO02nite_19340 [Cellulomonas composti]|uniref:Uncharacterized protein n=1 Tax=Cellulomonas composti TaxID=266130 RepID=A0A511JBB0_9CELL|nr:hypothetical protein CCO02nite_19340 [Cellulomonas composti]